MGKYIIDLPESYALERAHGNKWLQMPVNISGQEFVIRTVIPLTPYTEPDFEQVREKAYMQGLKDDQGVIFESTQNNAFNNGYKKCLEDMEQVRKEAYNKGYETAKHECEDCDLKKDWEEAYQRGYKNGTEAVAIPDDKVREAYQKGLDDAWEAARKIVGWSWEKRHEVIGDQALLANMFADNTAEEAIAKIAAYEKQKEEKDFGEVRDVLEETVKACNVTLDEIAEVLQKMMREE